LRKVIRVECIESCMDSEYQALSAVQRDVLFTLRVEGPSTGRELVRAIDSSDATIYRALEAVESRGLIERVPADDVPGPSKRNTLTDKGRSVTTQAFDAYREAL
jgi:DNA-binding MarR family transcriptional regulator